MKEKIKSEEHDIVVLSRFHDVSIFAGKPADGRLGRIHYDAQSKCVEATNLKVIVSVPVDVVKTKEKLSEPDSFVLDAQSFSDQLKKSSRVVLTAEDGAHIDDAKKIVFTTIETDPQRHELNESQESTFPQSQSYFKQSKQGRTLNISIGIDVLKRICDYARKHSIHSAVNFRFGDELSPVQFEVSVAHNVKATGIFLPGKIIE